GLLPHLLELYRCGDGVGGTRPKLALIVDRRTAWSQIDRGRERGDARHGEDQVTMVREIRYPPVVTEILGACAGPCLHRGELPGLRRLPWFPLGHGNLLAAVHRTATCRP